MYGCVLYDDYPVGNVLRDMAEVYALTEYDRTNPSMLVQNPIILLLNLCLCMLIVFTSVHAGLVPLFLVPSHPWVAIRGM